MEHLRLCFMTLTAKCKENQYVLFLSNFDLTSLARSKVTSPLCEGRNLSFASKEVELERTIPRSQFLSGLCFGRTTTIMVSPPPVLSNTRTVKKFIPPSSNSQGPSENLVNVVHKLEVQDESMPTSTTKGFSVIKNQPSSHWTANWYVPP